MTRRVAPYTDAPTPAQWATERRAAYRRTRALGFILCVLVLTMLMLVVVATMAAAVTSDGPAHEPSTVLLVLVWSAIFWGGVILGAFLRWMQLTRDDRRDQR